MKSNTNFIYTKYLGNFFHIKWVSCMQPYIVTRRILYCCPKKPTNVTLRKLLGNLHKKIGPRIAKGMKQHLEGVKCDRILIILCETLFGSDNFFRRVKEF